MSDEQFELKEPQPGAAPETERRMALPMDVQDAMRKNLPEQVSTMLRQRLEDADAALLENEKLKAVIEQQNRIIKRASELDAWAAELQERQIKVNEREEVCETRERHSDTFQAEIRYEAEKSKVELAWNFLNALAKNPVVKENVCASVSSTLDYEGRPTMQSTSEDRTRTTE